jgi:hypothetical protein
MAQRPVTRADIIAWHVSLEIEGFDRIYLNGWVPALVPEHQQLSILHPVAAAQQDDQAEYPARQHVGDLEQPRPAKHHRVQPVAQDAGQLSQSSIRAAQDRRKVLGGVINECYRAAKLIS